MQTWLHAWYFEFLLTERCEQRGTCKVVSLFPPPSELLSSRSRSGNRFKNSAVLSHVASAASSICHLTSLSSRNLAPRFTQRLSNMASGSTIVAPSLKNCHYYKNNIYWHYNHWHFVKCVSSYVHLYYFPHLINKYHKLMILVC